MSDGVNMDAVVAELARAGLTETARWVALEAETARAIAAMHEIHDRVWQKLTGHRDAEDAP